MHLYFKKLRSHPQPGPSRATISSPPPWDPPNGCFFIFSPAIATTTMPRKTAQTTFCTAICIFFHKILQTPCFLKCVCMFLQCFPSKHGNLHICRHKTVPKHIFYNVSNSLVSPNPWKHRYLHCFLQFFHVPMPLANSNIIYKTILQKHFFWQCFQCVFTMSSVKKTVIYTFFGIKSVHKTLVFAVFSMLWHPKTIQFPYLPKPLKTPLFTLFSSIFPCSNAAGQLKHNI